MFTWSFWKQSLERAVKSAAQFSIFYLIGANTDPDSPINFFNASFDADNLLGFATSGFVLSILTSIVSGPIGTHNSPSLVQ